MKKILLGCLQIVSFDCYLTSLGERETIFEQLKEGKRQLTFNSARPLVKLARMYSSQFLNA